MENENANADFFQADNPTNEVVNVRSPTDSRENDNENQCFLGCCHITTCAKIIGSLEIGGSILVLILASIVLTLQGQGDEQNETVTFVVIALIVLSVISFFLAVMMIYGIKSERPAWMLPNLIYQWIQITLSIVALVGLAIRTTTGDYSIEKLLSFLIQTALQAFFLHQMQKCYRYLKRKREIDYLNLIEYDEFVTEN